MGEKVGEKGEGVKNLKEWVTSFMDGPLCNWVNMRFNVFQNQTSLTNTKTYISSSKIKLSFRSFLNVEVSKLIIIYCNVYIS